METWVDVRCTGCGTPFRLLVHCSPEALATSGRLDDSYTCASCTRSGVHDWTVKRTPTQRRLSLRRLSFDELATIQSNRIELGCGNYDARLARLRQYHREKEGK